jgi:hypothetical protein
VQDSGAGRVGCETGDFPPAPAEPAVALIQRGTCTFELKATNAVAAGYDAVVLFNEGNPGREELFIGTLGVPFEIPVYGPFIAVGIPAGGLFSGAEGIKTPEQAAVYGGTAGVAFDPCYHQACDDITNLSTKALFELGDGAAHAVLTLARTRSGFFEDGSRAARARVGVKMAQHGPEAAR